MNRGKVCLPPLLSFSSLRRCSPTLPDHRLAFWLTVWCHGRSSITGPTGFFVREDSIHFLRPFLACLETSLLLVFLRPILNTSLYGLMFDVEENGI